MPVRRAEAKLARLKEQMNKEKETAVKLAVKNALEEAAQQAQAETIARTEPMKRPRRRSNVSRDTRPWKNALYAV